MVCRLWVTSAIYMYKTASNSRQITRVMTIAAISKKTRAKCCRVLRLKSTGRSVVVTPAYYTYRARLFIASLRPGRQQSLAEGFLAPGHLDQHLGRRKVIRDGVHQRSQHFQAGPAAVQGPYDR